jgi:hypothetical protein
MGLKDILSKVKTSFRPRKPIDFEEYNLHLEIEPLSTIEEIKVLEALKDLEGAEYFEALKRYTLSFAIKKIDDEDLDADELTYTNEDGSTSTKSKFLFMREVIGQWSAPLIDAIFDVFNNMLFEMENNIKTKIKFERYNFTEKPAQEEDEKGKFKPVVEKDENLDPVEKLNKAVEEEITAANENLT